MHFYKVPAASLSHTDEGAFFQDAFHIKTVKQPSKIMRLYRDFPILCIGKIVDPESSSLKALVVYDESVFIPFRYFDLVFLLPSTFCSPEKSTYVNNLIVKLVFHGYKRNMVHPCNLPLTFLRSHLTL